MANKPVTEFTPLKPAPPQARPVPKPRASQRPLSPHLQIYRLPLTAVLSISHRISGVSLIVGLLLGTILLVLAALGPDYFTSLEGLLKSTPVRVLVWGWIYALCFHFCHGIRHLFWDSGRGFEKRQLMKHNLIELLASILLTGLLSGLSNCPALVA